MELAREVQRITVDASANVSEVGVLEHWGDRYACVHHGRLAETCDRSVLCAAFSGQGVGCVEWRQRGWLCSPLDATIAHDILRQY